MVMRLWLPILAVLSLVAGGCAKSKPSGSVMTKGEITNLEAQVHLELPEKLSLLKSSDGGGRDEGFHIWVLHGPSGIAFSPRSEATVEYFEEYQPAPSDIVEWVSYEVSRGQLAPARSALYSTWKAEGYVYTAHLLRTERGDYMVIQRFRAPPEAKGN